MYPTCVSSKLCEFIPAHDAADLLLWPVALIGWILCSTCGQSCLWLLHSIQLLLLQKNLLVRKVIIIQGTQILVRLPFLWGLLDSHWEPQELNSNSFREYSFNSFLDFLTVVAVVKTMADVCKFVFLVQLPCFPIHPWPESNQDHPQWMKHHE